LAGIYLIPGGKRKNSPGEKGATHVELGGVLGEKNRKRRGGEGKTVWGGDK